MNEQARQIVDTKVDAVIELARNLGNELLALTTTLTEAKRADWLDNTTSDEANRAWSTIASMVGTLGNGGHAVRRAGEIEAAVAQISVLVPMAVKP